MRRASAVRLVIAFAFIGFTATSVIVGKRFDARPRPALRVGDFVLSTRDIALRNRILRITAPQEKRALGRLQLRQAYQFVQVLKDHGYPLGDTALEAEQERIEMTTQAPDKLRQILALFRGDQAGYRRVYVLPGLAEHALYFEFFLHDPTAQKESRARVESFLRDAERTSFEDAARVRKMTVQTVELGVKAREIASVEKDEHVGLDANAFRQITQLLRRVRPGEILPVPIDNGESWVAARYQPSQHHASNHLFLQCLTFQKNEFGSWAEREVARIPVENLTED